LVTAQANDQDFESRYEDLTLSIAEVTGVELSSAAYDACETLGDLECALRPHLNRGGDGHSLRQRAERDVRQVIAEALGRDAADIQPTDRLIDLVPAPKRKRLRRTLERSGLVLPAPLSPERYWSPNKWIDGIAVVVVWCFFVFALFLLPVFEISRWWTVPILLAGVLLASVIAVAFRKGPPAPDVTVETLVDRAVLESAPACWSDGQFFEVLQILVGRAYAVPTMTVERTMRLPARPSHR